MADGAIRLTYLVRLRCGCEEPGQKRRPQRVWRWANHVCAACAMSFVQVVVLDWAISSQSRTLAAANRSMCAGSAAWKAGRREACRSAWAAVWPPEAMRRSIQQAGSVQAAPRVGQAQSISQARVGETSTLSGVQSECVSTGPAKADA